MRDALLFVGIGAIVIFVGGYYASQYTRSSQEASDTIGIMSALTLRSPVFENGGSLPARFTCDGESMSPPLSWSGVPLGTKSLALIVEDPDVPKQLKPDGVFDHWTLFNIPPETTEIATGGTAGVRGASGTGKNQYVGPCPPKEYEPSEHRYFFRMYALDTMLDLAEGASKADVLAAMEGHVLAEVELIGKYKRQ